MSFLASWCAFIIGHGSATLGPLGRVFVFVLGALFGVAAFHRKTRFRTGMSRYKDSGVPISSAGRVIIFLMGLVLILMALNILH